MTKTISTSEARKKFATISNEVMQSGVHYVVLKNGKPAFEITPSKNRQNLSIDSNFEKDLQTFEHEYSETLKELASR